MEKCFIQDLKRILKRLCYWKWKAWYKLLSRSGLKKFCVRSLSPNILLSGIKYWLRNQLCSFENERLTSFSYTIWFMISEKNVTRCMFLHRDACMHQKSQRGIHKMWTGGFYWWTRAYILTEGGRSFKAFMKENYAIALDNTEKC